MDVSRFGCKVVQASVIWYGAILGLIYWPYIYAPATSPRWAFLAVTLPLLIKTVQWTTLHLIGLLFLVWSTLSLLWTSNVYDGLDDLIHFTIIAEAFLVGACLTDLKQLFIGLGISICASSAFVLLGVSEALYVNFNILAETALIVIVGLWVYKQYWLIIGLLPSLAWSYSRAAILIATIMFFGWLWKKSRFISLLVLLAFVILLFVGVYYGEEIGSLRFRYRFDTVQERLILWRDTILGLNWLGHGIGSYYSTFPFFSTFDTLVARPKYAHNDLLQIIFELGVAGALLIITFCWQVLKSQQIERYVFVAFIGISCFSFPLYLPVTAFVAAVVCGHIAGRGSSLQLSLANSRVLFRVWIAKWQNRRIAESSNILSVRFYI